MGKGVANYATFRPQEMFISLNKKFHTLDGSGMSLVEYSK